MIIAGLMSGSSLDGLDIAICDFDWGADGQIEWQLLYHTTRELPKVLADDLAKATTLTAKELFKLDYEFAKFSARSMVDILSTSQLECQYIASHGHTIYHAPSDGYSCQIGNGSTIAALSKIPTLCDFRMSDIALGGQGAPIAPIVEQYLFPEVRYFLNLGGIANISIHLEEVLAYDVCPCNQILNKIASELGLPYDDRGLIAAQGSVCDKVLKRWNEMAYFELPPPKSIDNSWVQRDFYQAILDYQVKPKDALATMCRFIADHIVDALIVPTKHNHNGTELMITGGGYYNDHLIKLISDGLPQSIKIKKVSNDIVNMKEAILMALMGYLRISNRPNNLPSVTGAHGLTCGGGLYLP